MSGHVEGRPRHHPGVRELIDEGLPDDERGALVPHPVEATAPDVLNIGHCGADGVTVIGVVHIHKTAGTTLASVFKRSFGGRHCDVLALDPAAPHLMPADLQRMIDRWYPRLDSALGHSLRVYAGLERVVGDIQWITFLRDPLERTASHYQYDVQRGGVDLPFEEWITHEAVPDRQTRIIAGPAATARDAIDLLGRFAFVGRSDRFDQSLVQMQRALRLRDIRYASKWVAPDNSIKKRLLGDPASRELLVSANRQDLQVWAHALTEIFPKQEIAFGDDLAGATAAFQQRNAGMTRFKQYATPRYVAYVAKWRFGYRPWVRKVTGDPTAG